MTVITFNAADEIVHIQMSTSTTVVPDTIFSNVCKHLNLNHLEHRFEVFEGTFSPNEFEFWTYRENDQFHLKEDIFCAVDKEDIVADGVDTSTVSNIPEGTEVFMDGASVGTIGTDGLFNISVSVPKKVVIVFKHAKHIDKEVVINAT